MLTQYTEPTAEQRQKLLKIAGESERLVKDPERKLCTTLSRSQTYQLEKKGAHPARKKLGSQSVAWLLSSLLFFIYQQDSSNTQLKKSN